MHREIKSRHHNYLETYVTDIYTRFKDIDVFIKTAEGDLNLGEAARLLDMKPEDITRHLRQLGVKRLTRRSFLKVMSQGESNICRLYQRELDCGSPFTYSREDISYIYNLKLDAVNKACDALHITEATPYTLPLIFSKISV